MSSSSNGDILYAIYFIGHYWRIDSGAAVELLQPFSGIWIKGYEMAVILAGK